MNSLTRHSREILVAVTAALGVMSSAGSPCCSSPTRTAMGMHPRIIDGGVIDVPDGGIDERTCAQICGESKETRHTTTWYECEPIGSSQQVECIKVYDVCRQGAGRRPANFRARAARGTTEQGAFFAALAELEAASVDAFEILAEDLVRFGAPEWMRIEALRAADDERRHARIASRLAHARGGMRTRRPAIARTRQSFFDFARDNAVEGCTRETFGALLAWHQAEHSTDADVRDAMRTIAPDETRHAALARAIHEWAMRRLRPSQREELERAMLEARVELTVDPVARVGLPSKEAANAMKTELFARL